MAYNAIYYQNILLCSLLWCPTEEHFQINICHNFQFLHSPWLAMFFSRWLIIFQNRRKSPHEGCLYSLSVFLNQFCLLNYIFSWIFFFFKYSLSLAFHMFPAEVPHWPIRSYIHRYFGLHVSKDTFKLYWTYIIWAYILPASKSLSSIEIGIYSVELTVISQTAIFPMSIQERGIS